MPSHDVASPVPRKVAPDTLPTRQRRMISDEKRRALCESFDRDPYPSKYQREAMATLLDMDERRIRVSTSLATCMTPIIRAEHFIVDAVRCVFTALLFSR